MPLPLIARGIASYLIKGVGRNALKGGQQMTKKATESQAVTSRVAAKSAGVGAGAGAVAVNAVNTDKSQEGKRSASPVPLDAGQRDEYERVRDKIYRDQVRRSMKANEGRMPPGDDMTPMPRPRPSLMDGHKGYPMPEKRPTKRSKK
jgi:hypothetical protein